MKIVLSVNKTENLKISDLSYNRKEGSLTLSINNRFYSVPVENVLGTYLEINNDGEIVNVIKRAAHCNNSC